MGICWSISKLYWSDEKYHWRQEMEMAVLVKEFSNRPIGSDVSELNAREICWRLLRPENIPGCSTEIAFELRSRAIKSDSVRKRFGGTIEIILLFSLRVSN